MVIFCKKLSEHDILFLNYNLIFKQKYSTYKLLILLENIYL